MEKHITEEEIQKEDKKKETDALREEKMNEWFKQQAKKMEKEILEHQEEEREHRGDHGPQRRLAHRCCSPRQRHR